MSSSYPVNQVFYASASAPGASVALVQQQLYRQVPRSQVPLPPPPPPPGMIREVYRHSWQVPGRATAVVPQHQLPQRHRAQTITGAPGTVVGSSTHCRPQHAYSYSAPLVSHHPLPLLNPRPQFQFQFQPQPQPQLQIQPHAQVAWGAIATASGASYPHGTIVGAMSQHQRGQFPQYAVRGRRPGGSTSTSNGAMHGRTQAHAAPVPGRHQNQRRPGSPEYDVDSSTSSESSGATDLDRKTKSKKRKSGALASKDTPRMDAHGRRPSYSGSEGTTSSQGQQIRYQNYSSQTSASPPLPPPPPSALIVHTPRYQPFSPLAARMPPSPNKSARTTATDNNISKHTRHWMARSRSPTPKLPPAVPPLKRRKIDHPHPQPHSHSQPQPQPQPHSHPNVHPHRHSQSHSHPQPHSQPQPQPHLQHQLHPYPHPPPPYQMHDQHPILMVANHSMPMQVQVPMPMPMQMQMQVSAPYPHPHPHPHPHNLMPPPSSFPRYPPTPAPAPAPPPPPLPRPLPSRSVGRLIPVRSEDWPASPPGAPPQSQSQVQGQLRLPPPPPTPAGGGGGMSANSGVLHRSGSSLGVSLPSPSMFELPPPAPDPPWLRPQSQSQSQPRPPPPPSSRVQTPLPPHGAHDAPHGPIPTSVPATAFHARIKQEPEEESLSVSSYSSLPNSDSTSHVKSEEVPSSGLYVVKKEERLSPPASMLYQRPSASAPMSIESTPDSGSARASVSTSIDLDTELDPNNHPSNFQPNTASSNTRKLITSSSVYYPYPVPCLKAHINHKANRKAFFKERMRELVGRGLRKRKAYSRDDGLVIEWTSSVPVWSDTLQPDLQDLATAIQLAYSINASTSVSAAGSRTGSPLVHAVPGWRNGVWLEGLSANASAGAGADGSIMSGGGSEQSGTGEGEGGGGYGVFKVNLAKSTVVDISQSEDERSEGEDVDLGLYSGTRHGSLALSQSSSRSKSKSTAKERAQEKAKETAKEEKKKRGPKPGFKPGPRSGPKLMVQGNPYPPLESRSESRSRTPATPATLRPTSGFYVDVGGDGNGGMDMDMDVDVDGSASPDRSHDRQFTRTPTHALKKKMSAAGMGMSMVPPPLPTPTPEATVPPTSAADAAAAATSLPAPSSTPMTNSISQPSSQPSGTVKPRSRPLPLPGRNRLPLPGRAHIVQNQGQTQTQAQAQKVLATPNPTPSPTRPAPAQIHHQTQAQTQAQAAQCPAHPHPHSHSQTMTTSTTTVLPVAFSPRQSRFTTPTLQSQQQQQSLSPLAVANGQHRQQQQQQLGSGGSVAPRAAGAVSEGESAGSAAQSLPVSGSGGSALSGGSSAGLDDAAAAVRRSPTPSRGSSSSQVLVGPLAPPPSASGSGLSAAGSGAAPNGSAADVRRSTTPGPSSSSQTSVGESVQTQQPPTSAAASASSLSPLLSPFGTVLAGAASSYPVPQPVVTTDSGADPSSGFLPAPPLSEVTAEEEAEKLSPLLLPAQAHVQTETQINVPRLSEQKDMDADHESEGTEGEMKDDAAVAGALLISSPAASAGSSNAGIHGARAGAGAGVDGDGADADVPMEEDVVMDVAVNGEVDGEVDEDDGDGSVSTDGGEVVALVSQFLQRYCQLFDADRSKLETAYAPHALFSCRRHDLEDIHRRAGLSTPPASPPTLTVTQGHSQIVNKLLALGPYLFCPRGKARNLHFDAVVVDPPSLSSSSSSNEKNLRQGDILLTVHGEIVNPDVNDPEKDHILALDQSFLLRRPEAVGMSTGNRTSEGLAEGANESGATDDGDSDISQIDGNDNNAPGQQVKQGWPLLATSHQMTVRAALLLDAERLEEEMPWISEILE